MKTMRYLFCSLLALIAFVLIFMLQNVLFLTTNSLSFLYETFFALSLYAGLCLLYFSIRFLEHKRNLRLRFLFAKTFLPAVIFVILVLCNVSFNFISVFSLIICFLLVFASLLLILGGILFNPVQAEESRICMDSFSDIFSEREKDVAELILQGKTAQETADLLFISLSTVKTHIQHIYEKADVHNRAEFALWFKNHSFS